MLVSELYTEIGLRIHDVANVEVTTTNLLVMVNMATKDLRNAGWLLPLEEDESFTEASGTYKIDPVPASFAYIHAIKRQNIATDTYDYDVNNSQWRVGLDGADPVIFFYEPFYMPDSGAKLKLLGQKRPTIYTAGADTVDNGCESFLRERASCYALRYVAGGRSELAAYRQQEAEIAFRDSEIMLARAPQQMRMKPNSRYIPGR